MKKRILVVENDQSILEVITMVLEEAGYETRPYRNVSNLFKLIMDFHPDAVILDILQPTLEGTELCQKIKNTESTSHIPVIALSTHSKIEKVKEICADDVISKPFDIDGLLEVLHEQLRSAS